MTASLPHDQTLSFQRVSKQNPRRFPAGGSCQVVRSSLEVALSAEQHVDGVLVLHLIQRCRLGNRWGPWAINRARVLLVQLRPVDIGGEGEVLDRGPDDVGTDDCDVKVRVAVAGEAKQRHHGTPGATHRRLGSITVLQLGICTVDAGGPEGIPVMGETTAEAPGLDRLKPGAVSRRSTRERSIS